MNSDQEGQAADCNERNRRQPSESLRNARSPSSCFSTLEVAIPWALTSAFDVRDTLRDLCRLSILLIQALEFAQAEFSHAVVDFARKLNPGLQAMLQATRARANRCAQVRPFSRRRARVGCQWGAARGQIRVVGHAGRVDRAGRARARGRVCALTQHTQRARAWRTYCQLTHHV